MSELSDRLRGIIRPLGSGVASGFSRTEPDVVPRANPSDLENLLEGRWYGPAELDEQRILLEAVLARIEAGDYQAACGRPDCEFCGQGFTGG